jgi:hypothetical protein
VLDVLGTTPHLHSHLGALNSILNTENVTTLVEFSDTMRGEGVQVMAATNRIPNITKFRNFCRNFG